jgi:hypothetical protein
MHHRTFEGNQLPGRPQKQGCVGSLIRLVLLFVLLGIGYLLFIALVAPWGFYLGGKFHPIPYWQGSARLHSKLSGDYAVYLNIWPSTTGRLSTFVTGTGSICTPRGERFQLKLIGTMRKHLSVSTNGEHIYIKIFNWHIVSPEARPRIEFEGQWQNPNLVMNDDGSISRSFQPDGSVYLGHDPNHPYKQEVITVTFTQSSYSDFKSACQAIHH